MSAGSRKCVRVQCDVVRLKQRRLLPLKPNVCVCVCVYVCVCVCLSGLFVAWQLASSSSRTIESRCLKLLTTGYSSNTRGPCQDSAVASGNVEQLQDLTTFPKPCWAPSLTLVMEIQWTFFPFFTTTARNTAGRELKRHRGDMIRLITRPIVPRKQKVVPSYSSWPNVFF